MGFADLHLHTVHSWDGTGTVRAVLKQATMKVGLDVVAITDHDAIDGALQALEMASEFGIDVIPGTEVSTADGHLLALDVQQIIPAGMSLLATLLHVGEQGGFCIAPHPLSMGKSSLGCEAIEDALQDSDAAKVLIGMESFNGGVFSRGSNGAAALFTAEMGLTPVASSDSHVVWTIGCGATQFDGSTAEDLRRAMYAGRTHPVERVPVKPMRIAGSWVRHRLMRTFGWPDHVAPGAPVAVSNKTSC